MYQNDGERRVRREATADDPKHTISEPQCSWCHLWLPMDIHIPFIFVDDGTGDKSQWRDPKQTEHALHLPKGNGPRGRGWNPASDIHPSHFSLSSTAKDLQPNYRRDNFDFWLSYMCSLQGEPRIHLVVIAAVFIYYGCNYPLIEAESLHSSHVSFISLWLCTEPKW